MKELIINNPIEKIEREGTGYKDLEKYELTESEEVGNFGFEHAKYKKIIQEICESWSPATNNDFFLYIEVLRCLDLAKVTQGKDNYIIKIPRDKLKCIVSSESVRRARQSLNSKGLCLPTNKLVIERRSKREKAIKKYFQGEKHGII
jgi:hypothetical protein